MKRLMLVADHSLVVHAIRLALRQTAGFQVVGFIDGRAPAVGSLIELRPDVVLVDDMENQQDAIHRLQEIEEHAPAAKTILLTGKMEDEWLDEVFAAGAHAAVSKTVHTLALGTLLRELVHGNVVHRRTATPSVPEACPLTPRELEILRHASQGMTNGQIARDLWVTEQTVKFHLSNTYRKLGVANRTEASRYAHLHRLVPPREQLAS